MRKRKIITKNKEIYKKLTMLNFSPEAVLMGVKLVQIDKILKGINKDHSIITSEILGNEMILLKKVGPINFDIYLR